MIEVISSSLYPDLKGRILFSFLTSPMSIINRAGKQGFRKKALLHFAKNINMSIRALTGILSITERTLRRKKDTDLLSESLSEHLLQLAEVYSRGEEVFSDIENFKTWFDTGNMALGNKKPVDLLSSRYGAQMVLIELGRMEHGEIS